MSFVALTLAAAVLTLLVGEIVAWCPWVAGRAIRSAARSLPTEYQARYEEEWLAEMEALPAKGLTSLIFAARVLAGASRTASALSGCLVRLPVRKRLFDIVVGSIMITIVAPLMAAIAVAIRIDSKGPVLVRARRIGRGGVPFHLLKYRAIVIDAGERTHPLRQQPRITRVGAFLRRMSLDELPQLINVLRGEMSLVGPLPLPVAADARADRIGRSRRPLPPGLTGPWQVLAPQRVRLQEMLAMDNEYVANWSFRHDVKLLLRSMRELLRRRA